ncbi:hypothetical protein GTY54_48305 [Streptomyces sp. SID625]|nr:hypothetical protein [Streptomyces sp. SID625]
MISTYGLYVAQDDVGLTLKEATTLIPLLSLIALARLLVATSLAGPFSDRNQRRNSIVLTAGVEDLAVADLGEQLAHVGDQRPAFDEPPGGGVRGDDGLAPVEGYLRAGDREVGQRLGRDLAPAGQPVGDRRTPPRPGRPRQVRGRP